MVVAGTIAIASGALWWRFGPVDEVSAAFPARGWAVIADFDNRTGDAQIDRTVQESLLLALQQSSYVNVFSRDRMFDALRRMRRPDEVRISEPLALEVCRRESAQVLLAGSIVQSGDATRVTVRALTPAGQLLFAEIVELGQKEQFFVRIDDLARRVRRRLGESLDRIQQASEPLDKVTTQSFDALRLYTQAVDRMAQGAMDDAAPLLQAALTLDSQFAMAHRQLARVFGTPGNRAKSLEHLEKAFELRAHVSVRERYFIEAAYYNVHERYDDAVESLSLLAALYPDDFDAQYELATVRSNVGEVERAIQATREVLRIQPQSLKASELLVLLLAINNQGDEALDNAQRAIAALGATARLRWGMAMALMGLGRLDDARRELSAVEASGTAFQGIGRLYLTRLDLLAGQLDAASAQLVHDIDDDHRMGRGSAELLRRYLLARVHLLRGQSKDAREQAVQIAAAPASVAQATNLQHAALVFVQVGDLAAARGLLQRLDGGRQGVTIFRVLEAVCIRSVACSPWPNGRSKPRCRNSRLRMPSTEATGRIVAWLALSRYAANGSRLRGNGGRSSRHEAKSSGMGFRRTSPRRRWSWGTSTRSSVNPRARANTTGKPLNRGRKPTCRS